MKSEIKPTIGRIVVYVWPDDPHVLKQNNYQKVSPAIIVNPLEGYSYQDSEVNLKVLADGVDDIWATSIPHDPTGQTPRSWHWPPRA